MLLLHRRSAAAEGAAAMAYRRRLKNKKPPEGWELIEEVVEDFELQVSAALLAGRTKQL